MSEINWWCGGISEGWNGIVYKQYLPPFILGLIIGVMSTIVLYFILKILINVIKNWE